MAETAPVLSQYFYYYSTVRFPGQQCPVLLVIQSYREMQWAGFVLFISTLFRGLLQSKISYGFQYNTTNWGRMVSHAAGSFFQVIPDQTLFPLFISMNVRLKSCLRSLSIPSGQGILINPCYITLLALLRGYNWGLSGHGDKLIVTPCKCTRLMPASYNA